MINTLAQFKLRVNQLDDISNAYDVFEVECSEELRSVIYNMSTESSPEPLRDAMIAMGYTDF